jgi:hypothetical protein
MPVKLSADKSMNAAVEHDNHPTAKVESSAGMSIYT